MRRPAANDLALSVMLGLAAVAVLAGTRAPRIAPVFALDIARNRAPIADLDQARDVESTRRVMLDTLDLARDGRFAHARLGELGYGTNYFVDIVRHFDLERTASYRFVVTSDDGFALAIDGRRVCAFTTPRAMNTQTCSILLSQGRHEFRLAYFQAGGPAGLRVQFGRHGESRLDAFGAGADGVSFPPD